MFYHIFKNSIYYIISYFFIIYHKEKTEKIYRNIETNEIGKKVEKSTILQTIIKKSYWTYLQFDFFFFFLKFKTFETTFFLFFLNLKELFNYLSNDFF